MKVKYLVLCFLAAFLISSSAVKAEDINSLILTTNVNYPDTLVAAVAAEKIGAPLLLTEPGELSTETKSEIEALGANSTIYIVGGPSVITEEVEEELEGNYRVVRLWGMTRYGTAVEVANYFWDESAKVVLVWDALVRPSLGDSEMISQAKELAIEEGAPLLLTSRSHIPSQVESALVNLSVQEVILIGSVGSGVLTALDDLGIIVSEHIKGPTPNETKNLLKEKLKNKIKNRTIASGKRPLVVIAIGNWSDTIKAPYMPNGTSRHITSEDQIDDLIAEIKENNYSRILVVGKPDLARIVRDRLIEAGISPTLLSGKPATVARLLMQREKAAIRKRALLAKKVLKLIFSRKVNSTNIEERSSRFLSNAERILNQIRVANKTRIMAELTALRDEMLNNRTAGDNESAWRLYTKLVKYEKRLILKYRERLAQRYQDLVNDERLSAAVVERLRAFVRGSAG